MSCPMTAESAKYLTHKEVDAFCREGCSVDCEKFFIEYLKRIKKAPMTADTVTSAET